MNEGRTFFTVIVIAVKSVFKALHIVPGTWYVLNKLELLLLSVYAKIVEISPIGTLEALFNNALKSTGDTHLDPLEKQSEN